VPQPWIRPSSTRQGRLPATGTVSRCPAMITRSILIGIFLLLTTPVAAHVIGQAAYRTDEPMETPGAVDESGDIIETTLDESGEPVNEEIVGTVDELPTEEEYTNEEGQTVRTVKEQRGALIHIKLGPDGSILDLRLPPQKEEVKEEEVLEEGRSESSSQTS